MNTKLCVSLGVALVLSLASCEKEPFRQEPKPSPNTPEQPLNPKPEEPAKPEPKTFEAADFKEDMLSAEGVLTLPEHFIGITPSSLDDHKAKIKSILAPSVSEIADATFQGWDMLVAIDLPKVTKVGNMAFEGCNSLTKVELPELVEIGNEGFAYCGAINTLNLPKLTKAGNKAFVQCHNLTKAELPMLEELGEEAFSQSLSLVEVSFPMLKKLGNKAFYEVYSLRKVTLGEAMPEIAEGAFLNTSVAKELIVPASAEATYTDWANKARFVSLNGEMTKLTENFDELPNLLKIGGRNGNTLRRNDDADEEELTLSNFTLSPSVKTIDEDVFSGLINADDQLDGYFVAFGVEKIKNGAFNSNSFKRIEFPNATNVANGAFSGSKNLEHITLPKLGHVQETVFEGTGIEFIHLPSATKIDKNAFFNCGSLKYLVLGATVPQTPDLKDKNSPLNDSIFGLEQGGSPVKAGQVTVVVPDASLQEYLSWKSKYTQVREVIPMSKFKR